MFRAPFAFLWLLVNSLAFVLSISTARAQTGQTLFWDANGAGSGVGGSGDWLGGTTWRLNGDNGALQPWTDGNAAEFDGNAGTVAVTLNGAVSVTGLYFGSSDCVINGSNTITLTGSQPVISGPGDQTINANLSSASQVFVSVSGYVNLGGANNFAGGMRLEYGLLNFNTNGAGGTGSGAGTITIGTGYAVLTNSASLSSQAITVENPVNLSHGTASFGASGTSNMLNFSGQIFGTGTVWIVDTVANSGASSGGVTVFSNSNNNYTGTTRISTLPTGVLRLDASGALSPNSGVLFGAQASANVGAIDLHGTNQTVASIATADFAGTTNGITNTIGATQSTLTINGNASTNYNSSIGVSPNITNLSGSSNNIALTLASTNTGTLNLHGVNTYSGTTTISGGTLNAGNDGALGGTASIIVNNGGTLGLVSGGGFNRINDSATMTLNGGKFITGGFQEHGASNNTAGIGALTLQSSSIIDMGNGASIIAFANSAAQSANWGTGRTISIYNWSGTLVTGGGTDQLFFGNDATGLSAAQLADFQFYSGAGTGAYAPGAAILTDGEVLPLAPVPEPSTWMAAALAVGVVGWSVLKRRRTETLKS